MRLSVICSAVGDSLVSIILKLHSSHAAGIHQETANMQEVKAALTPQIQLIIETFLQMSPLDRAAVPSSEPRH